MFAGTVVPFPRLSGIQALYTLLHCDLHYHVVTRRKPLSGGLLAQEEVVNHKTDNYYFIYTSMQGHCLLETKARIEFSWGI